MHDYLSKIETNSSQTSSRSIRSSVKRAAWPMLVLIAVAGLGLVCIRQVERLEQMTVEAKLQAILEAATKTLSIWKDNHLSNARYIAARPEVEEAVLSLVRLSEAGATNQQLVDTLPQVDLAAFAEDFNTTFGYYNYAIVSRDGRVLADSATGFIGQRVPEGWNPYLPELLAGNAVVAKPHRAVFDSYENDADDQEPYMFVAAPVCGEDGSVVAAIGFGILAASEFTEILSVARAGESGETYAFDDQGWMLSDSRFDEQLRSIGLLPKESNAAAVLNVRVVDPGEDLTSRKELSSAVGTLPFTEIVTATLDAKASEKSTTVANLKGYCDYRGVKSVAVSSWLPEHDFGVVTKIDYAEAYAPRIFIRNVMILLFSIALLGVIAGSVYRFSLENAKRRIARATQEIRRLGQYTLAEKIGEGGMGEVYRATHAMLRRPTAVKMLRPEKSSEAAVARFETEVQVTAGLTHPNTIAIYDYGRDPDGVFYYAMEYLEGPDLKRVVDFDGPQPASRVISILQQACASLREAHEAGLIHRDIKPGNIILCRRGGVFDVVKVLDFGLVRNLNEAPGLSRDQGISGTPVYMSPESIDSPTAVDARSDIYALGAVGYFLLTATDVFIGRRPIDVFLKHMSETPMPPAKRLGRPVDSNLARIIMQCLEKDPVARPQSVVELSASLAACAVAAEWTQAKAMTWWESYVVQEAVDKSNLPTPGNVNITNPFDS